MLSDQMKLNSVIICDDIRSEISGREILIGVYSGIILLPKFPIHLPSFAIRLEFQVGDNFKDELTVEMVAPNKDVLISVSGILENKTETASPIALSIVQNNIKFSTEGLYKIQFGKKGKTKGIYSFMVKLEKTLEPKI